MEKNRTFQIYSLEEICSITGLKMKEIWRAIRSGKLKIARLDGKPYVTDRALVAYLEHRALLRYRKRKVEALTGRRRLPRAKQTRKGNAAIGRLILIY
jgi:hypothetical protein